ncbi:hypothetical protein JTS96_16325 [Clostridium botulinum]|nr:hypothetical protein [Clostridium botulinum]
MYNVFDSIQLYFFPSIDFYREKDYNITVVRYKFDTIMLCNYESNASKDILKIKHQVKPDKVVTNIKIIQR